MKGNAIVRICLYSLLILLLAGVLFVGMFGVWHRPYHTVESMAAIPVTGPTMAEGFQATVVSNAVIYSSPSEQSTEIETLIPGQIVTIDDVTVVMGEEWGHIDSGGYVPMKCFEVGTVTDIPVPGQDSFQTRVMEDVSTRKTPSQQSDEQWPLHTGDTVTVLQIENIMGEEWAILEDLGWIQMRYLEAGAAWEPPSESEPVHTREIIFDEITETVTSLDIDWPYGKVWIKSGEQTGITMGDEGPAGAKEAVYQVTENNCLKVEFGPTTAEKTLYLTIPQNVDLKKLKVRTKSAEVLLYELPMSIRDLDVETESGSCRLENLNVETLDFESVSGALTGSFPSNPGSIDLETVSGNLDITLPESCGFTINRESDMGHFSTDFAVRQTQSGIVCGNGVCQIRSQTVSGNLNIWKPVQ